MWQMVNKSSIFAEEYRVWHTPVISAYLFWRFATMYMSPGKGIKREAPSCILFFILGGILRQNALIKNYIIGRKTLITMLKAIKKSGDADLIDTIHNRIRETMSHTSQAIDIAVASGMLEWDFDKCAHPYGAEYGEKCGNCHQQTQCCNIFWCEFWKKSFHKKYPFCSITTKRVIKNLTTFAATECETNTASPKAFRKDGNFPSVFHLTR